MLCLLLVGLALVLWPYIVARPLASGRLPGRVVRVLGPRIYLRALRDESLNQPFYQREPLDEALFFIPRTPGPLAPRAQVLLVAQVSRTGSTLFCRTLAVRGDVLVLSEPACVSDALLFRRGVTLEPLIELFFVASQGRPIVLKLPSICCETMALERLRRVLPGARRLQLTRPLEEVLRSHERSRTVVPRSRATRYAQRALLERRHAAAKAWAQDSFSLEEQLAMTPEALSARVGLAPPCAAQREAMLALRQYDVKQRGDAGPAPPSDRR